MLTRTLSNHPLSLQGWRLHSLSRQLLPLFAYSHSKKSGFLCFRQNIMNFDLCVLSLSTTEKSVAPLVNFLPSGLYTHWCDLPCAFNSCYSHSSLSLYMKEAPDPLPSSWPLAGLTPVTLYLSYAVKSRTGAFRRIQTHSFNKTIGLYTQHC